MSELKPCPFCGGTAGVSELKGGKWPRFYVVCFKAGCIASESYCFGRKYTTVKEAIEAWNRRFENETD